MSATAGPVVVGWDGDVAVASDVLTRGFSDYAVPRQERPEDVREQMRRGYIEPGRSFVALDRGVAVGGSFAAARPDGCARLHALAVDPRWRRRGIGRALLGATLDELSAAGISEVGTEVLVDNHAAIALYTAAGFRPARRLTCLRGVPPAGAAGGVEVTVDALRYLPPLVRPLHRDRIALRRIEGARVAVGEHGGWIAWHGAVLLDLVAEAAELDALLAWLPPRACTIIDVPEGDPLLDVLRSRGWEPYATQVELFLLVPGPASGVRAANDPGALVIRALPPGGGAVCERILRLLPRWFAIEASIVAYRRDIETMETWTATAGDCTVGFVTIHQHTPYAAEVHVMGVRQELHRRGIGRRLLQDAATALRQRGIELLQVKTRGPSAPDPDYARTRAFYAAQGFRALEETTAFWGAEDPCLIMVKTL